MTTPTATALPAEAAPPLPTCRACGVTMPERVNPDALAAELGTWYDHPVTADYTPGYGIGHDASAIVYNDTWKAKIEAEKEAWV